MTCQTSTKRTPSLPARSPLSSFDDKILPTDGRTQHLRRKTRQQPRLIRLRHLLKNSIHRLALSIPNTPQPIPRNRARNHTREIRDYESHRPSTQPTNHTPELARRSRILVRHPFLPQHLLEYPAKLVFAELVVRLLRVSGGLVASEPERAPGESAEPAKSPSSSALLSRARTSSLRLLLPRLVRRRRAPRPTVVRACGVVLAAPRGV